MQTNPAFSLFTTLAGPLVGLLVVAVAGYFVVMRLRRASRSDDSAGTPFSLEDLRRLRREGKITDEEYSRAHAMIVGAAKARLSSKDAPEPGTEPRSRLGASQKTSRDLRGQNRRGARGRPTEIEILPEHGAPEQGDGTGSGTDESVD